MNKVPFVGPDNEKGAEKGGDDLAKQLKAGDEVGIIEGVSTTANAQQRTAGFKAAMLKDGRVLATADQYAAKQAVFGIDTAPKALSEHKKQADLSGVVETPVELVTK